MITADKITRVQSGSEGDHIVCSPDDDEPRFGAIMIYECATQGPAARDNPDERPSRRRFSDSSSGVARKRVKRKHFSRPAPQHSVKFGPKYDKCYYPLLAIAATRPRHSVDGCASEYALNENTGALGGQKPLLGRTQLSQTRTALRYPKHEPQMQSLLQVRRPQMRNGNFEACLRNCGDAFIDSRFCFSFCALPLRLLLHCAHHALRSMSASFRAALFLFFFFQFLGELVVCRVVDRGTSFGWRLKTQELQKYRRAHQ